MAREKLEADGLREFIETRMRSKGFDTWEAFRVASGLGSAVSTNVRRNVVPGYDKLMSIADTLDVPLLELYEVAGIVRPTDLKQSSTKLSRELRLLVEEASGLNPKQLQHLRDIARSMRQLGLGQEPATASGGRRSRANPRSGR